MRQTLMNSKKRYIHATGGLNLLKIVEIIWEYFSVYVGEYRPYKVEHTMNTIMPNVANNNLTGKSKLINAPVYVD